MESILTSTKKMLGIAADYDHFDADIIMHINSVFMTLNQLGVGPDEGFMIMDEDACWSDFLPSGQQLEGVKTYMYQKVRLMFDPPVSSATLQALERQVTEWEWRLNVAVDPAIPNQEVIST